MSPIRGSKASLSAVERSTRTLHLLDIENLIGGATRRRECAAVFAAYHAAAAWAPEDHAVVAAGPSTAEEAFFVVPAGIRRVLGRGLDGADRALLAAAADTRFIARRYGRVVIGSGDGAFAPLALELRVLGVEVWVVGKVHCQISRKLAAIAHVTLVLEPDEPLAAVS